MKYTSKVIYWLDYHNYSKNHWAEVAAEMLEKADGDADRATELLAAALEGFHHKFKDAVVKPDNVLFDLIETCLEEVDWHDVARSRYS